MTEEELLDNFETKVKRYLTELDKSSLIGSFGPAANAYFDAAQNLGASLLLRMVEAYRNSEDRRASLLREAQQSREMALAREQAIAERTAMEHAGAMAIAALRGVAENEALTADQHASVAAAILAMMDAKPRWTAETGRISPNSGGDA
jgi:hypothetical protein